MKCPYDKEELALLLMDSLDEQRRRELEEHIAGCRDCRMEFKAYQKVWALMKEIPQPLPPDKMRDNFNVALNNYEEQMRANKKPLLALSNKFRELWRLHPWMQFTYGVVILVFGLTAGYLLNHPVQKQISYNRQIDSLSSQVSEMKQMMMLSLLENPSASQRIRAVGYTDEISNVNKKVIDALLTTLNEDPNVNVRLMTLDALVKLSNEPTVREGLVQSIALQESPLLQSAIADVMVKLQEKRSVQSLQKLLGKKDLNEMVKLKIEQSIHKLI